MIRAWRAPLAATWMVCAACATPARPLDATRDASSADTYDDAQTAVVDHSAIGPETTPFDRDVIERDRADTGAPARCYGVTGTPGLLEAVASIPRETWGFSNGSAGCVGDVDGDGRRELVLLRMSEPSELIGADFCSRGRVLLPEFARGCTIADVDGIAGDELIVTTSVGWTQESAVYVGRVRATRESDRSIERFVFERTASFDERRPISPVGAPHAIVTDLDDDGRRELAVSGNFPASFARVWERSSDRWEPLFDWDLRRVMDESHGWIVGDSDGDGRSEALLLSNCGFEERYAIHRLDRWDSAAASATPMIGPAHAVIADLDGVAPPELVTAERHSCQSRTGPHALRARRWDPAARQYATVAELVVEQAPSELVYVAAMDVEGSAAHEIIRCSSPVVGTTFARTCRAFALRGASTLEPLPSAAAPFVWTSAARRVILSAVLADDLDRDGRVELFLMGQDHVDVLRGPRR